MPKALDGVFWYIIIQRSTIGSCNTYQALKRTGEIKFPWIFIIKLSRMKELMQLRGIGHLGNQQVTNEMTCIGIGVNWMNKGWKQNLHLDKEKTKVYLSDKCLMNSRSWRGGLGIRIIYIATERREWRDGFQDQLPAALADWRQPGTNTRGRYPLFIRWHHLDRSLRR